jgi:hypothetical protein
LHSSEADEAHREPRDEGRRDVLVDEEPVGRGAGLAHVAHLGGERTLDRGVQIGVFENEERRIPAEFHRSPQHGVGGLLQ